MNRDAFQTHDWLLGGAAVLLIIDLLFGPWLSVSVTTVRNLGGSRTQTRYVLAVIAAGFVALKFVLHIHFGSFAFAFCAAIVLCVALVVVARRANGAPGYVPRIR